MTAALEYIGQRRILAGSRADLVVELYRDGLAATPTGSLTFSAADALGTVVASGVATAAAGKLTATLTAAQSALPNQLTVTWAGLVFDAEPAVELETTHEIVGAWLFGLAEARRYEGGKLTSETTYPASAILEARDRITDQFEDILGYAMGRRYALEQVDGNGSDSVWLNEPYVSSIRAAHTLQSDGTWLEVTGEMIVTNAGRAELLASTWPRGTANVRIAYEAGIQPVPLDLKEAALELLVYQMVSSDVSKRATQQTNEHGQFTLGAGEWFGLVDVDKVLTRRRRKLPGIA